MAQPLPNQEYPDWSPQFQALLSSPLGAELLSELSKVHDRKVADAEGAKSPDEAFGLLKEASGVTIAIGHLQFLAVPKGEGSGDKK